MKKIIIISLTVFVIVLASLYFLFDFPIILNGNQKESLIESDTADNIFNPIKSIDFNTGNNRVYLYFGNADIAELPKKMIKSKLFECSNNEILQDLKRDFIFKKSGGDMSTCESKLLVYKNDKLVFCSSFVLTDNVIGLQNSLAGWADALNQENLKNNFLKFKPTRKIFIKL
jgi:hypothetical protein